MTDYFAHSENDKNKKHLLSKHLHETAKMAESFACQDNFKPIFRISGLIHDLGKYQPEFQNYLENGGRRGSVPHAAWGAGYAGKFKINEASIAYTCGQIFAKMESIQYAALGERNAGIREKFFSYAMTTPAAAFGRLFNLNSKHFTKLKHEKPGLAVDLDKGLQELCSGIDIENFPAMFRLEEQGQFAIGYYHQRQKQFADANITNKKEIKK